MKRSLTIASLAAFIALSGSAFADTFNVSSASASTPEGTASIPVAAIKGRMLTAANGSRLAPVYRIGNDGSPQIILEGKLVTIPVGTLSLSDGKLSTSLTKSQILALR
jgi:hypothetical protein